VQNSKIVVLDIWQWYVKGNTCARHARRPPRHDRRAAMGYKSRVFLLISYFIVTAGILQTK
jgi:hypothetical protein